MWPLYRAPPTFLDSLDVSAEGQLQGLLTLHSPCPSPASSSPPSSPRSSTVKDLGATLDDLALSMSSGEYVSPADQEYLKFREDILAGAELGSLSCDELNDRISAWALKGQEGVSFAEAPKWKARIKRQWKREGKKWALEQRGGQALPVRSEEVQTALSEHTRDEKESSPPNEADLQEGIDPQGEVLNDLPSAVDEQADMAPQILLLGGHVDEARDAFCAGLLLGVSLCLFVFGFTLLCLRV